MDEADLHSLSWTVIMRRKTASDELAHRKRDDDSAAHPKQPGIFHRARILLPKVIHEKGMGSERDCCNLIALIIGSMSEIAW